MIYNHHVPGHLRIASRWDPENMVWVTPTDRTWIMVDPGIALGHETRDSSGQRVLVSRWYPSDHLPYNDCLTPEHVAAEDAAESAQADRHNAGMPSKVGENHG